MPTASFSPSEDINSGLAQAVCAAHEECLDDARRQDQIDRFVRSLLAEAGAHFASLRRDQTAGADVLRASHKTDRSSTIAPDQAYDERNQQHADSINIDSIVGKVPLRPNSQLNHKVCPSFFRSVID